MDGFHLAQVELQRLGRAARKGAPDTFDALGYVALLQRLRTPRPGEVVYAPAFHREIEEPIAGAIAVAADVPLVITEGNYLLLDDRAWADVRALLDEVWYVDGDDARAHRAAGAPPRAVRRSEAEARAWVAATDEPNARLIEATRGARRPGVPLGAHLAAALAHRLADRHVRRPPDHLSGSEAFTCAYRLGQHCGDARTLAGSLHGALTACATLANPRRAHSNATASVISYATTSMHLSRSSDGAMCRSSVRAVSSVGYGSNVSNSMQPPR